MVLPFNEIVKEDWPTLHLIVILHRIFIRFKERQDVDPFVLLEYPNVPLIAHETDERPCNFRF